MQWLVRWLVPDGPTDVVYNDWRLVFETGWGPATTALVVAVLVLSIVFGGVGLRRLRPANRTLLISLRILAGLALLFALLQPAIELRAVSPVRTKVLVAYDASSSMNLEVEGDRTRAELVSDHTRRNRDRFDELSARASVEVFTFSKETQPLDSLPDRGPVRSEGARTDIARLLSDLAWQAEGRDVGAAVIYSDGSDTEALDEAEARRLAKEVGAPIHTIGFGPDDSAVDLAIRRIRTDDFAFVHNTVTLEVEVESHGLSASRLPVTLKRDGGVLQTQDVFLDAGSGRVAFEFKPKQVGKEVYTVSVPVQPGEAVATNNTKSVVLRVIRDRIRVLQVAGRPSWDVRFLRELLKQNPNVDLISFFILRSTTDVQKASQDELALIPFPVNDLFTTELDSFDVVIYQNFSYRPYRMAHYLRNVRRYVLEGGSFLMIGGDQSFEPGYYSGTPIADILPVRLGGVLPWDPNPFRPRLSEEGRRHPITRIGGAGLPPDVSYGRLPELQGMNGSIGLMPGAQALLEHPALPGNPPVVAIRQVGKGRSMAVATDSSWFWRFVAVGEDGTVGREYDRFWNQSLRWLIRDPELSRVRIQARHPVVYKGQPVTADVTALGVDYRPLEGADVQAELIPLDSRGQGRSASVRTGAEGKALVELSDVPPGTYVMEVAAYQDGERLGRTREPFIIEATDVERQAPFPRADLLQAISDVSGGTFSTVRDRLGTLILDDPRRVEVDRSHVVPIWDGFPLFALMTVLLGAEWWMRRRSGLV
ncbi:MAG: glutamine amidotransferase [Myxococcota bacterium]